MGFNTLQFVFIFLPCFLVAYYVTPARLRNVTLCLGGLGFYAMGTWDRPWCLGLFLGLGLGAWFLGRLLGRTAHKRAVLTVGLVLLFGILLGFKYAGLSGVGLPLGISFYTFQLAAYLMEVAWGGMSPTGSLLTFSAGQLLFPKLLSGPLMAPAELEGQVRARAYSLEGYDEGLREFILGLSMKLLLADRMGVLWRQLGTIGYESVSTPLAWMGIFAYSFQLYFDFCGYSRMAIGLGKMLGFRLPENFDHPYAARSIRDFWRRWHITLGAWFRTYVYIPLGGNRKGKLRMYRNLLIVWLLTALWHGITWNFLLWGLAQFFLIAMERLWLGRLLDKSRVLSHLYMLGVIPLSWLLFAMKEPGAFLTYLGRLFPIGAKGVAVLAGDYLLYGKQYGLLLLACFVFAMPWPGKLWERIRTKPLGTGIVLVLFWAAVYCMAVSTNDPFLYFSF